jgi:uncharacterized glyoxalase superfamily protein PhnB
MAPASDVLKANRSIPAAVVIPVLTYPDVGEAVAFLTAAFGFTERVRIPENHRAQMAFGAGGGLIVADSGSTRRPPQPDDGETHSVMVRVDDVDAHVERARANGARILQEPRDYEYGERQYHAQDPAGHRWTFSQTLDDVEPERFGAKSIGGA